jgi:methyl-galactoside transport system substrate-binding protein
MNRKIIALILTGIISVLLITGCSSQTEGQNVSSTDTTQETAQITEETSEILPAQARIGIAYVTGEGEFTPFFISKTRGYLISAGILEENIERAGVSQSELADIAKEMIAKGCHVLMVGGADAESAPGITNAAAKADIPVLYFGTSPGEEEIARWEKEGIRAAYVGSTYEKSAAKRADLIASADIEKIDESGDEEIGYVALYTGEEKPGDMVNRETIRILEEQDVPIYELASDDANEISGEDADEETAEDETAETGSEEDSGEEQDEEPVAQLTREDAKEQVIEWMKEYGKDIEVIFCADDMQALGAYDAISEEKKRVGHDVLIMGFESSTDSLAEIAAGNIRSSFFNDFMEQSMKASEGVLAFLKGVPVQTSAISDYVSVTVDNAQEILDISLNTKENDPELADSED